MMHDDMIPNQDREWLAGLLTIHLEKHLASRNGSIQSADDGIVDSDDGTVTWPSRQTCLR